MDEYLKSLLNLAQRKKDYLKNMLELSQKQSNVIENQNEEDLKYILDEKDSIIEKINKIDLDFKSIKDKLKTEDEVLTILLSEVSIILNKIKLLDDANNEKLKISINDMKINLKDVRQGKRAMNNYSNSDPYESFVTQGGTLFIDQDS